MPRGSTNSTTRGTNGRENFDREHLPREVAPTVARVEGTSGSNAGRRTHPRSSGIRDSGGMTGGQYTYQSPAFRRHGAYPSSMLIRILGERTGGRSTNTSGAFRGHGTRRATAGDVYDSDAWSSSSSLDDDDDDDSDNDTVAGEDYASRDCCDLLAGDSTRPRHGELRGPRFESTPDRRDLRSSGSRETVFWYADDASDHSTDNATDDDDDDSDYRPRGGGRGAGASTRRGRELHPANHGAQDRGEPSSHRQ